MAGDSLRSGGNRLCAIGERYDIPDYISDEDERTKSFLIRLILQEQSDLHHHPGILNKWKPTAPMVILLTKTVIFTVTISFSYLLI